MKKSFLTAILFSFSAALFAGDMETLRQVNFSDMKTEELGAGADKIVAPAQQGVKAKSSLNLKYTTYCKMDGSTARGYVRNSGDAFTIEGNVWFYFFDDNENLVDKEDEYEYEYVSRGEDEEVEYTSVPSGAASCSFDIKGAIKDEEQDPPPHPELSYLTRCFVKDGYGRGWVHNMGDAFSIEGDVWFYFYDRDGRLIDEEDEYEYEYVGYGEDEEVEYTQAPSGAETCSFNIDKAIAQSKGKAGSVRASTAAELFAGNAVWPSSLRWNDTFRITRTCEVEGRVSDLENLRKDAEKCASEKVEDACDGDLIEGPDTKTKCGPDTLSNGTAGIVCLAKSRGVCKE
ncbi:MAG: hypothetical protein COT17_08420 [Elusimicrobia bacterium CG08_land_8_20_14_0_20_51_18]|nr:MAG: hypothetical protein COT17_08420 [Elusimicrobia bacterium CG08_land_8_20_14_0_20_51_18]